MHYGTPRQEKASWTHRQAWWSTLPQHLQKPQHKENSSVTLLQATTCSLTESLSQAQLWTSACSVTTIITTSSWSSSLRMTMSPLAITFRFGFRWEILIVNGKVSNGLHPVPWLALQETSMLWLVFKHPILTLLPHQPQNTLITHSSLVRSTMSQPTLSWELCARHQELSRPHLMAPSPGSSMVVNSSLFIKWLTLLVLPIKKLRLLLNQQLHQSLLQWRWLPLQCYHSVSESA